MVCAGIQAIAAAHWPLTPPAGGSTSTTNPGELKILLTSDFTFRIEWIPLDENRLFVEMCLHWNSRLLWIVGGWLLCLCASLLINSVETEKTAADAFLSSPPQIYPAHQIWVILRVIFVFLYSCIITRQRAVTDGTSGRWRSEEQSQEEGRARWGWIRAAGKVEVERCPMKAKKQQFYWWETISR